MARSMFGSVIEGLLPQSKYKYKAELAKDIGIPKSTFSNWIHGRHSVEYNAVLAIAQRLNTGKSRQYRELVFLLVDALAMDEATRQERSKKWLSWTSNQRPHHAHESREIVHIIRSRTKIGKRPRNRCYHRWNLRPVESMYVSCSNVHNDWRKDRDKQTTSDRT